MPTDDKIPPFEHLFRVSASGSPGNHCTYCPLPLGEKCVLPCIKNYEDLQRERAADGVTVTELTEPMQLKMNKIWADRDRLAIELLRLSPYRYKG